MKRKLLFLFALLLSFTISAKASTCSDERIIELSTLANNVNVTYVGYDNTSEPQTNPLDDEVDVDIVPSFYIAIYNITDQLNAVVKNETTKKSVEVTSKNAKDGVIYVDAGAADSVKTFTVTIRSNNSNCMNEVLKTTTVTTPMYNRFFEYELCEENPDFNMCQQYTFTDYSSVRDKVFQEKVEEYKVQKQEEEKNKNVFNRVLNFIVKYMWVFIIIVIIIVASVIYFIIRRKKSRLV